DLDLQRFRDMLRRHHCGLIGQTAEIAPADRKLYALRDATGTVESIPLIASSIMSKKLAEGLDGLVLDVKVGSGAFMKRQEDAAELARTMVTLGHDAGVRTTALLTDMDQPLGACIGNALEVRESIEVLRGGGPSDLRELTLELGAEMLLSAGTHTEREDALRTLTRLLDGGYAFERFRDIAADQGGDPRTIDDPDLLPSAERTVELKADAGGWISAFDTEAVGRAASLLGAGRARKEDPIDPAVGIVLHARRGARVESGDPLATLHVNNARDLDEALRRCRAAIRIVAQKPEQVPLILDRIEAEG
ncbi:MAG: thymidine phosphorylase, partial [Deltaproteobacteria bacterium]